MKKILLTICTILIFSSVCTAGCLKNSAENQKDILPDTHITTEDNGPSDNPPEVCPHGDCENNDGEIPAPKPRRKIKRRGKNGNIPHPPRQPRPMPKPVEPIN